MNKTRLGLLIASLPALFLASAFCDPLKDDLHTLVTQHKKDVAEAMLKINKRYLEQLNFLLKRAMLSDDMDTALKIKQELQQYTTSGESTAPTDKFQKTVWRNPAGSEVEFDERGRFLATDSGSPVSKIGKWELQSETAAVATLVDGTTWHFTMADDGSSVSRLETPRTFKRVIVAPEASQP